VWDFSIGRSLGLMARTAPFIMFRMAVYFGIACAYVIVTGTGAGIGWGVGGFGDEDFRAGATMWGGIVGFGLTAGVIYLLREYILYIVKAGHIAVLVDLLDGKDMPDGKGQIAHARTVVTARFAETSVLFAIDQLVKGVLAAVTGLIQGIASVLPIPGLQQIMGLVRAFLRIAIGLIDEVILAYAIRSGSDNPWASARTALVLYGQNAGTMLKNAAVLTVIVYGLSFLVFLLMLAPAAAVVYLIPGAWSAGGVVFALIFAWAVKAALIEPFAIACMMQVFFKVTAGQTPDPAWDAKLSQVSKKFNAIKDESGLWTPSSPDPAGSGSLARQHP
jgi:multisubunit Na+/H+ antiporter MnhC subunit